MTLIRVQELFYSRVEAPYSRRNTSGYQVVYHSPALDRADVKEIEDQLRCFEATQITARYQVFHLTSGMMAAAVSQQIDPVDTRITDRAGRPGPFIAHCLIMPPGDWRWLDNNPFRLFDESAAFVTDVETMIEIQQQQPNEREIEIMELADAIPDYDSFDLKPWSKDQFIRLWDVAADAQTIVANRRSVAVQAGDEGAIEALLRLLLSQLDFDGRSACTFNTFVDGCEPPAGRYWLLGSTRRIKQSNAIRIHLDRGLVDYETPQPSAAVRELAEKLFDLMREAQGIEE